MQAKVSVIIPCFNASDYISKCLASIMDQRYENLEIICVNDGSEDDTLNILQHFQSLDDRIIIVDQPNGGISAARNAGIQMAKGKFMVFVDADDWLSVNALQVLLPAAENCDMLVFSYWRELGTASLRKELGIQGNFEALDFQRKLIGQIGPELRNLSSFDALAPVWGKIYRTALIKERVRFVELKDIGTWEDGLFNVEYLEHCRQVHVIDEPYYHYRKTNVASYTSVYRPALFEKWSYKFTLLQELIQSKDVQFTCALENRIAITFFNLALVESRSSLPFNGKVRKIRNILNNQLYKTSFKNLDLKYLPLLWRPFYFMAQLRLATLLLLITISINQLLSYRNQS